MSECRNFGWSGLSPLAQPRPGPGHVCRGVPRSGPPFATPGRTDGRNGPSWAKNIVKTKREGSEKALPLLLLIFLRKVPG
jgi:hypothetical protein